MSNFNANSARLLRQTAIVELQLLAKSTYLPKALKKIEECAKRGDSRAFLKDFSLGTDIPQVRETLSEELTKLGFSVAIIRDEFLEVSW